MLARGYGDCVLFLDAMGVLAFGLALLLAGAAGAQDPATRVLVVTVSDLDDDHLDFLTGWERGDEDILDLASRGVARFALVPLAPELRFAAVGGERPGLRALLRRSRRAARPQAPAEKPARSARSPRRSSGTPFTRKPAPAPPFAGAPAPWSPGARPVPARGQGQRGVRGGGPRRTAAPRDPRGSRNPHRRR